MHGLQSPVPTGLDLGHDKFFRSRLLVSTPEQISRLVDDMEVETVAIRREALQMAWYMRGGITYDQALQLSVSERGLISELIKEHLETTKKSGLPFF